jgi:hypothetical protein
MQGLAFLIPLVGVVAACVVLGVNRARYYRAQKPRPAPKPRPRPVRALSDEERAHVLATLDSEPFMDKAPAQVYAKLLEDGEYLCSERTMYRVLAEHDQVRERPAHRRHPEYNKPQFVATAPNQVCRGTHEAARSDEGRVIRSASCVVGRCRSRHRRRRGSTHRRWTRSRSRVRIGTRRWLFTNFSQVLSRNR